MDGREVLRVDQSKPEAGEGFRSLNRLGKSLPLRRLCHAPHSSYRQADMNFEIDSKDIFKFIEHAKRDVQMEVARRGDKRAYVSGGVNVRIVKHDTLYKISRHILLTALIQIAIR